MSQSSAKIGIPPILESDLTWRFARIKPVVRFVATDDGLEPSLEGNPYYIQDVDLRKIAYTWDPKPTLPAINLEPVEDIITYHSWGYYGFFKPSIAEVLAQIPSTHIEVVAFEIVDWPKDADDLNRQIEVINAGFHQATTRLYRRKI